MAADLERLAIKFGKAGHPEMEVYLNAGAKIARKLGVPESFSVNGTASQAEAIKVYPEISLEEEWQRQAEKLARLFAQELGFKTLDEYMVTLPKFEPQPKEYRGRLDTPVIVETRISPARQCQLAGIRYFLDGLDKNDWNGDPGRYRSPEAPYATWLEDGRNNLGEKPEDVRKKLKDDERCGTELDGIALCISNPKILEHHFLDLPGTSVGSDHAAYLPLWFGRLRLNCRFVDDADPRFGSVVCGRQK